MGSAYSPEISLQENRTEEKGSFLAFYLILPFSFVSLLALFRLVIFEQPIGLKNSVLFSVVVRRLARFSMLSPFVSSLLPQARALTHVLCRYSLTLDFI